MAFDPDPHGDGDRDNEGYEAVTESENYYIKALNAESSLIALERLAYEFDLRAEDLFERLENNPSMNESGHEYQKGMLDAYRSVATTIYHVYAARQLIEQREAAADRYRERLDQRGFDPDRDAPK